MQSHAGCGTAERAAARVRDQRAERRGDRRRDEAGVPVDVLDERAAGRGAGGEAADHRRDRPRVGLGDRARRRDLPDQLVPGGAERRDEQPGGQDQHRHQRDRAAPPAPAGSRAAAARRGSGTPTGAAGGTSARRTRSRRPRSPPPTPTAARRPTPARRSCDANAGRLISTAPKQKPTGSVGEHQRAHAGRAQRAEHAVRAGGGVGSPSRDGGRVTNSATPDSVHAALSASAAIGETAAMIAAAISGPDREQQLDRDRVERERGREQLRPARAGGSARARAARPDVRDREAADERAGDQRGGRCVRLGQHDQDAVASRVEQREREQHAALAEPVDDAALQRRADRGADPEGAVDEPGDRERAPLLAM